MLPKDAPFLEHCSKLNWRIIYQMSCSVFIHLSQDAIHKDYQPKNKYLVKNRNLWASQLNNSPGQVSLQITANCSQIFMHIYVEKYTK